MAAPSALYKFLRPEVAGCPVPMLELAVMSAARSFCELGYAWRDYLAPIAPVEGTAEITLTPPAGARVCKVLSIDLPDGQIISKTMAEIQRLLPNWQSAEGTPAWFNSPEDSGVIRLFPIPRNLPLGFTLTPRAVLVPTLEAVTLPDALVNRHHDALVLGAKAALMGMKDKAWSNPVLAVSAGAAFRVKCDEERARMIHDNVGAALRAQPRRFG